MITFETQEAFEEAVMDVLITKLALDVETRGEPFIKFVKVGLRHVDDCNAFASAQDRVY